MLEAQELIDEYKSAYEADEQEAIKMVLDDLRLVTEELNRRLDKMEDKT